MSFPSNHGINITILFITSQECQNLHSHGEVQLNQI